MFNINKLTIQSYTQKDKKINVSDVSLLVMYKYTSHFGNIDVRRTKWLINWYVVNDLYNELS